MSVSERENGLSNGLFLLLKKLEATTKNGFPIRILHKKYVV